MPRKVVGAGAHSTRHTLIAQLVTVTRAIAESNHNPKPPMSAAAPAGLPYDIKNPLATTTHVAENTHAMISQRKALFLCLSPLGAAASNANGVATAKTIAARKAGSYIASVSGNPIPQNPAIAASATGIACLPDLCDLSTQSGSIYTPK